MKRLISFLILGAIIVTNCSAQKIVKEGFFLAHLLGNYCNNNTSIAKMELNSQNQKLVFYSWNNIAGSFDLKFLKDPNAKDEPQTKKEKFGSVMKKLEAYDKANTEKNGKPGIGLLSYREMDFSEVMLLPTFEINPKGISKYLGSDYARVYDKDIKYVPIYSGDVRPNTTYTFNNDGNEACGRDKRLSIEKIPLVYPADLVAKYPSFDLSKKNSFEFNVRSRGEGAFGIKNIQNFVSTTEYTYQFNPSTCYIESKSVEKDVNKEEFASKTAEYAFFTSDKPLVIDENSKISILRGNIKDDKWSSYKAFNLLKYDKEGKILFSKEIKPEFLKEPRYYNFVYNKKGEKAGIVVLLSSFATLGGKTLRDPKDNRHLLYYFDLEGNEKFHCVFEHGDGDNPRGINPILFVENDGKLQLWNCNYNKIFKPFTEVINIDANGKGTFTNFPKDRINAGYTFDLEGKELGFKVLEDGNFLLTSNKTAERDVKGANGTVTKENFYSGLVSVIVTPDFQLVNSAYFHNGGQKTMKIEYLGKLDGFNKFVLKSDASFHVAALGEDESKVQHAQYPRKDDIGLGIPNTYFGENYVIDKATRKIYAAFDVFQNNGLSYLAIFEY